MEKVSRGYRDRDYLETEDGLLFTVIGNVHPKDRVLAYLKYIPYAKGKWGRRGNRFRRAMRYYSASNVMKAIAFLRKRYPRYIFTSDTMNITFSAVPIETILRHYQPERALDHLRESSRLDSLQSKALELSSLLSERSGVSHDHVGVTGSILLGVHKVRFSDVDLVVYGGKESRSFKQALLSLYQDEGSLVQRLSGRTLRRWCWEQSYVHPLTREEAEVLYLTRKWNKGLFRNTIFSIHPTRLEEETSEVYGQQFYRPRGIVTARARVIDATDSYFLPAVYVIDDVRCEGTGQFDMIQKVVSYEGLYADIAQNGEIIVVRGKLEDVLDKTGKLEYRRILVGSREARGSDYVKVVTPK